MTNVFVRMTGQVGAAMRPVVGSMSKVTVPVRRDVAPGGGEPRSSGSERPRLPGGGDSSGSGGTSSVSGVGRVLGGTGAFRSGLVKFSSGVASVVGCAGAVPRTKS